MTNEIYPKNVSALVVIDHLNDFLSECAKAFNNIKSELERVRLIPNLKRLLAGSRAAGQIVYAPHGLNEHSFDQFKYVTPRLQVAMQNHVFGRAISGTNSMIPCDRRTATSLPATIACSTRSWAQTSMRS